MLSFILQWNQDPENRDNLSLPLYDSIERLEIRHWNWVSFGFSFLADLLAKFNEFNDNGRTLKGPLDRFTKLKELKLVYEHGGPDGDDEIAAEILEDFKCFLMQLLPIWEERGTRIVVENWNELPRIAIFESESAVSTYSW
ncbi:uncharacterized protein PAC_19895 [Phialocephala subalpina]|uniref:Uncharacterized protein n=1 Tax=Phialocephala subalpina TaxID=576137 RepID=A0A1L7XYB4_9HELO|nr:uncharacterized protein PAC_19895 [Phialocephala subalpina]